MKKELLLISDSRELYWHCSRKLSGKCDILHSNLKDYKNNLHLAEDFSILCVVLDTSVVDSLFAHEVRSYVAQNIDCPFFTIDSNDIKEELLLSKVDFIFPDFIEPFKDKGLLLESPSISFFASSKKDYMLELEKFALHEEPVLLTGESGCGKSYAAKIIHVNSSRKNKPFIRRNIAELNPLLIESELFGCVKGAFTDAVERQGLFEQAKDGTLFIDEIGELSLENQSKLLGVLDTGKFCRVGSSKEIEVKCRLIFATDSDLKIRIKERTFKKQLYWRIIKFVIYIPPLRERKDEIIPLAIKFAKDCNKKLSEDALSYLESLDWDGNIRQLMFCIQRSSVLSENKTLLKKDLIL